jgi:zinc/manganese transport system substrate-binding protein
MKGRALIVLVLTVSLFLLPPTGGSPEKPLVIATITPLASIVEEAFGDSVDVVYIIPPGIDPHEYQLTAEQVELLQKATVIVTTGGHLPVERKIKEMEKERVIKGKVLFFDDYKEYGFRYLKEHWYSEKENPHGVWLDPTNALAIAEATEEALKAVDPQNAELYQREFETFKTKVEAVILSYRALITKNFTAVVQMPPCQYAAEWLGIKAVSAIKPEEEIPAKGVDEILPDAKNSDIIIYSLQSSDQLKDAVFELSKKSGKPTAGITVFWKDKPYTEVLIQNSAAIVNAIGGKNSTETSPIAAEEHKYSIPALFAGLTLGIALGYLMKK